MNSSENKSGAAASPLPHTDTKPVGAAGFYTAINATFRFIEERFGREGLIRYWREIGSTYYKPVSERWSEGGLDSVAEYWRAFFAAEPGTEAEVSRSENEARVQVRQCPLIRHLRQEKRGIVPCLCQHCYFVSESIAEPAGLTVRIKGGNGSCEQRFFPRAANEPEQRLEDILTAS